jgi:CTD small phosphatase-like protein 2
MLRQASATFTKLLVQQQHQRHLQFASQIAVRYLVSRSGTVTQHQIAKAAPAASRTKVHPSLARRRPHVNGEPVAFHVKDLVNLRPNNPYSNSASQQHVQNDNKNKQYESDIIVVLDMDECLIHSQFLSSTSAAYAHQLQQQRQSRHRNGSVETFQVSLPEGDLVHVHMRPGLPEFLARVTEKYETHIFTAAMPIYAKPVLKRLDPHQNLTAHWYRDSCTFHPTTNAYVKQLEVLPPLATNDLSRVVLVDNNPLSFLANPDNGILVSSFYDDPHDDTLEAVWKLLQELEDVPDVRPTLRSRFGLQKALEQSASNAGEDDSDVTAARAASQ